MKPLFKEVYSFDKKCYEKYKLNEDILMENAASNLEAVIPKKAKVINIIAGPGNNGADGITLARRILSKKEVNLYLPLGVKSPMAKLQLERFEAIGGKIKKDYEKCDCVVDAIFGSGLKKDLSDELVFLIKQMNNMDAFKIACDIPTGIDDKGNLRPVAFRADVTVTMGAEKLSLYNDFAKDYVGEIIRADLGVSFNKYIDNGNYYVLEKEDLVLPFRKKQNSHKKSYGYLGVLAGDKKGASVLAAKAAFNFGCGLVSIVSHENFNIPYEIMFSEKIENHFNALAFGMGMGGYFDDEIENILKLNIPMVIDADMFYKEEIKEFLKKDKIVITPHPKEFSALLKILGFGDYSINEIQQNRFKLVEEFSVKYPKVVLLLKGANKIIAFNKKLYIDPLGNVSLAKGGSGDVLAGMIGGLLAQGYNPFKATMMASLAHSVAGNYEPNYALTPEKLIKRLEEIA